MPSHFTLKQFSLTLELSTHSLQGKNGALFSSSPLLVCVLVVRLDEMSTYMLSFIIGHAMLGEQKWVPLCKIVLQNLHSFRDIPVCKRGS